MTTSVLAAGHPSLGWALYPARMAGLLARGWGAASGGGPKSVTPDPAPADLPRLPG